MIYFSISAYCGYFLHDLVTYMCNRRLPL